MSATRWFPGFPLRWLTAAAVLVQALPSFAADDGRKPLPAEQVQQLRHFSEVYTAVKNSFVDEIDDKKLVGACLTGMLSGIDPDSAYIDSDAFQELTVARHQAGVGLELGMEDGALRVITPIEGSPSDRAGIQSGDLIIRIDDAPTKGMTLSDGVKRLRGKPNSHVTLTVSRKDESKPLAFPLQREVVQVQSVKTRLLAPGYALLRVAQFQEQTGAALVRHLQNLYLQNPPKGLVLDLRNNPGGLLSVGVGVAAAFLPANSLVLSTRGRTADAKRNYLAVVDDYSRPGLDYLAQLPAEVKDVPMVVLVNGGSAASSEIVAGALQDHKRAIILGTPTFGRASIQMILPLENRAAIKLTTARWFTPKGHSVQSKGIVPDIVVAQTPGEKAATAPGEDRQIAQALSLLKDFRRE